jgi:hypothetical protein
MKEKWYSCCQCPYQFKLPDGIVISDEYSGRETAYCSVCWDTYNRRLNERGIYFKNYLANIENKSYYPDNE